MMDYLYHYTSIENLALILKFKTIRFTPLDQVDDKQEGIANDVDNYGQFVFVSCWTTEVNENIPLWNMYSKDMSGVRIALPRHPFWYYSPLNNPERVESYPFSGSSLLRTIHVDGCHDLPWGDKYLITVEYDRNETIPPEVVEELNDGNSILHLGKLGKFKDGCWKFQQEVRYRIVLRPLGGINLCEDGKYRSSKVMKQKFIDIPIRQDAFESMQIMLGPRHVEANKIILDALLDTYNRNVKRDIISSLNIRSRT